MRFIICTNEEIVRNRAGVSEDDLGAYTSADLVKAGADAAEAKLAELCGFDVINRITYDNIFRNWKGGNYSKTGKFSPYQSCGELLACDIESPSMMEICHKAHDAYDEAIEKFVNECLAVSAETIE